MTTTRLALHGGEPIRNASATWPTWPIHDDSDRDALLAVLDSGQWFYGERVKIFEAEFASFQGATHCITCNSGTTAGEIILQAHDIGMGDEVIVPPYTFVATASAVLRVGAMPIFVDLDDTWCMNPDLVEAAITPKTKAIMPVHFGGRVCDMDKMNEIADKHNVPVIEDACHSWGARWKDQGTGVLGKCGFFSFQLSKNLTAGEGGAMVTNDAELAARLRSIANCGRAGAGAPWYHHVNVGTNARLTEFQAALLSSQLKRLDAQNTVRAKNAAFLNKSLADVEGLTLQPESNRITKRAYHLYCMRINAAQFGCSRENFIRAANAEGWPVVAGYPMPLYKQPVFAKIAQHDYSASSCPVAEDLCYNSGMWFPHQLLLGTEQDMSDIVAIVKKIKANAGTMEQ